MSNEIVIKQNEIKLRESNIELLRIFSMFFIVLSHFAFHGIIKYYGINNTLTEHFNNCFTSFLSYGGRLGVDIFILITGYFMINSSLKIKHFFKIYLLTIIYSWLFLMIAFFIGSHEIDSGMFRRGLFPVLGGGYWFISDYLLLYVLIPFINLFVKNLKHKESVIIFVITTILWAIIPTISPGHHFMKLYIFIYMYVIGAWIRLGTFKFLSDNKLFSKLALFSLLFIGINIFINFFSNPFDYMSAKKYFEMNSAFIIIFSIFFFNYFKSLNINYNKYINYISASVLSVYLIHDNIFIRGYLWSRVVKFLDLNSVFYFLITVIICISVYLLCVLVDKIFKHFVEKPVNKISDYLQNILTKLYEKI